MDWQQLPLDRIYYDVTLGVPGTVWPIGTPGVPSNTIADVITMLVARNLKKIEVHGAVTLAVDVSHKDFFGNYHESVADIVTLAAGNDVDDSHFAGLIITGAQGGTGLTTYKECMLYNMTGFRGLAENCAIYGTLVVATGNADYADFDHCTSVHGQITVTIAAPDRVSFKHFTGGMVLTAQTAGAVLVRGISGYLEVEAMDGVAATLDIYADAADIVINASCLAGTINIYGNARVTGAGGGVTINDYSQETQLDVLQERTNNLPDDPADESLIEAAITAAQDNVLLDTQVRSITSTGKAITFGAANAKWLNIDSDTNGAEILAIILNNYVGKDWTVDTYVPYVDDVAAPAAIDKRDTFSIINTDAEGGLLKPTAIAFNMFLDFTNDAGAGDETMTVTVVYRSRAALTLTWEA